jgi:hypothetical protein
MLTIAAAYAHRGRIPGEDSRGVRFPTIPQTPGGDMRGFKLPMGLVATKFPTRIFTALKFPTVFTTGLWGPL